MFHPKFSTDIKEKLLVLTVRCFIKSDWTLWHHGDHLTLLFLECYVPSTIQLKQTKKSCGSQLLVFINIKPLGYRSHVALLDQILLCISFLCMFYGLKRLKYDCFFFVRRTIYMVGWTPFQLRSWLYRIWLIRH